MILLDVQFHLFKKIIKGSTLRSTYVGDKDTTRLLTRSSWCGGMGVWSDGAQDRAGKEHRPWGIELGSGAVFTISFSSIMAKLLYLPETSLSSTIQRGLIQSKRVEIKHIKDT